MICDVLVNVEKTHVKRNVLRFSENLAKISVIELKHTNEMTVCIG